MGERRKIKFSDLQMLTIFRYGGRVFEKQSHQWAKPLDGRWLPAWELPKPGRFVEYTEADKAWMVPLGIAKPSPMCFFYGDDLIDYVSGQTRVYPLSV